MATDVRTPYTQEPGAANSVIFPNHKMQMLDTFVNTLGLSILSYCLARRTYHDELLSIRGWSNLTWPRVTIILTFVTSWIFVFASTVLVSGIGLSYSVEACKVSMYLCIVFYCLSKMFLYCFLVEKVYVVWGAGKTTRFKSPVYRLCFLVLLIYVAVIVLLFIGHISEFRQDGVCVIGLKPVSSIPLLAYDLFVNVFLTGMFVFPLVRSGFLNNRLRSVSARALIAATAALTSSSVNIAILTAMHGRQLGWVCLASCCTDVTLNALVLFWVTSPGSSENSSGKSLNKAVIANPPSSHDDNRRRTLMTPRKTGTYDLSRNKPVVGQGSEDKLTGTRGSRGWLSRLRTGGDDDSAPMEVQVTITTELEMVENPSDRYGPGSSTKSLGHSSRDLEKDIVFPEESLINPRP